jgi:hypothetical protein
MTVQITAPTALHTSHRVYERHTLYHFITLSLTATSAFVQDIQQPDGPGVATQNEPLIEMRGEQKERRQAAKDQLAYCFWNNFIKQC